MASQLSLQDATIQLKQQELYKHVNDVGVIADVLTHPWSPRKEVITDGLVAGLAAGKQLFQKDMVYNHLVHTGFNSINQAKDAWASAQSFEEFSRGKASSWNVSASGGFGPLSASLSIAKAAEGSLNQSREAYYMEYKAMYLLGQIGMPTLAVARSMLNQVPVQCSTLAHPSKSSWTSVCFTYRVQHLVDNRSLLAYLANHPTVTIRRHNLPSRLP